MGLMSVVHERLIVYLHLAVKRSCFKFLVSIIELTLSYHGSVSSVNPKSCFSWLEVGIKKTPTQKNVVHSIRDQ